MTISITKYEIRITNLRFVISLAAIVFTLCVFTTDASAQNPEELSAQINRGDTEQKRDALLRIRNLESEAASRLAVSALKDSSEIVRATATFSVIYLSKDEAAQMLLPLLLKDKSALVRREAAYALGKVGNSIAVVPLLQTIQKDKVFEVQNAAVVALGEIGDASAVDALVQTLQRKPQAKEDFLRRGAARSIGQIAQIIQTDTRKVTTPETFAPEEFKNPARLKYPNLSLRFPIFKSAVSALIQTLQNKNETDDTKREAAFALGAIGDRAAISVLQSSLNSQDYYLVEIIQEALKKISITAK